MRDTIKRVVQAVERKVFGSTAEEDAERLAAAIRRRVDRRVEEIFIRALSDDDEDETDKEQQL